ncbi:MAG: helix-turn-helix domain-containing protein [Fimbriimonadaceae bacterium]|nr:helix-turn-helix domain-containing protein [Fimbriimonadaceae bacterium]
MAKEIDPNTKARGIALLLSGSSIGAVAKELRLSKATVQRWHDKLKEDGSQNRMHTAEPAKQVQIEDRMPNRMHTEHTVVHTLKESRERLLDKLIDGQLRSLIVQQEHHMDKKWLSKQTAGDLAILYGVGMDKAVRLFEAIEKAKALRKGQIQQPQMDI